jgi:nitrogenase subunit NifH
MNTFFRNETLPSIEDEMYEPISMEVTESGSDKKWIGCANHTLQSALKVLDNDSVFLKTVTDVVTILRQIVNCTLKRDVPLICLSQQGTFYKFDC